MQNVLVVAELGAADNLKSGTLSAISFAKAAAPAVGGSFDVLVLGVAPQTAAAQIAKHGATKVMTCSDPSFGSYVAEQFCPTVAEVAKNYSLVVAAASSFGKDLLPRVAARLDAAYAGDCADVNVEDGKLTYKRPMFAGNAFGFCQLSTGTQVATVRQSEVAGDAPGDGTSAIESIVKVSPSTAATRVEFVSLDEVKSERPDLTDAKIVVSGGRALKDKFFDVLNPLVDKLGAGLGASRAAVDAGYCPGDFQVGQTGKIVAPQLYFAIGISGAIQHVAGMKGSKTIVAINKDPDAPIFQIADYGLVEDLFTAVPALVEALPNK
jgi:electron transfer flavoprotein alpha subunit